jgi:NitT/TauT family transport system ATP-binding protein
MPNDSNLNNPIISFDRVSKAFEGGAVALRDVSFSVSRGEFVCIIGPSGGGKSTILNIIAGLEKETSGMVKKPKNISMVFQSSALLPWLTAHENVIFGLEGHVDKDAIQKEGEKYLLMMELGGMAKKFPRELSGGERQRVGIARALAVKPSVLLLDEPFSALDPKTTEELHKDLIKIWRETKTTIVMVSHLIEEAVALSERVMLIKNYTVQKTFSIDLARPRRENEAEFAKVVLEVRREFFK